MRRHPIFDELQASLSPLMPEEPVAVAGTWLPSTRRTYVSQRQNGTGLGPFADVVDVKWHGTLTSPLPIAGIAFLATPDDVFWAKSLPATASLPVEVSLHAYADHLPGRATFVGRMGGAALHGIAVDYDRDLATACELGRPQLSTTKVELIARVGPVTFGVLLISGRFLKVGRHRLWRVREEISSNLPQHLRAILTRGRSGIISHASAGA